MELHSLLLGDYYFGTFLALLDVIVKRQTRNWGITRNKGQRLRQCGHSAKKDLQGAALLTSGLNTVVLNSRCYLYLRSATFMARHSWEFTTQSRLNCLTALWGKVTFLYPGTMSNQLLLWLWCRENSPPWILNIELNFYLCGHKETGSQFGFNKTAYLACQSW